MAVRHGTPMIPERKLNYNDSGGNWALRIKKLAVGTLLIKPKTLK